MSKIIYKQNTADAGNLSCEQKIDQAGGLFGANIYDW